MNKTEFISILKSELLKGKVNDIDDILFEFEEHFAYKIEEGKTEEEVIKKMGNPIEIANDYKVHSSGISHSDKMVIKIGLIFADFFTYLTFLLIWISLISLGIVSIALLVVGILLVTSANIASLIPTMPYLVSLIYGVSILGLAVIAVIGTIYMYLYVVQWHKTYQRWRKNILNDNIYPSLSMHPMASKRLTSKLKLFMIFGTFIFVVTFIIGYVVAAISSGSFEFWHVWEWFS